MEQRLVMQLYYIVIVVIVMGSLAFFMKSGVGEGGFERDFLSKEIGMVQSSAMIVNDGLEVEMELIDYGGKYGFEEMPNCEIRIFENLPGERQQNVYYCFGDQNKDVTFTKPNFYDIERFRVYVEQNNVILDADENVYIG